ncbi:MAG TPA: (2Fe-2S)-binding protein [Verrucomicrobiales bacterium]|nr:(2Fe-2S)-binding protein [Verrucomicrobiales bacterium]
MAGTDTDDDLPDIPMSDTLKQSSADRLGDVGGELDGNKDEAARSDGTRRREFFSIALGSAIVAAPTVVGLRVVLSPLFSSASGGILARLTTLDSLAVGGPPQAFKVVADKTDAWTTYKDLPLGLVYVQRVAERDVLVFSASCPHAGCAVEYRNEGDRGEHYYCPCHESSFKTDGSLAPDNTQAKRGLDTLEVIGEKLQEGEIWIRFQKFKAGISEKKAVS